MAKQANTRNRGQPLVKRGGGTTKNHKEENRGKKKHILTFSKTEKEHGKNGRVLTSGGKNAGGVKAKQILTSSQCASDEGPFPRGLLKDFICA